MNLRIKSKFVQCCIFAVAAPFLVTGPRLLAQATEAAQKESKLDDNEKLILSPFIVEAEENEGYGAVSTLAGTRVRTDLKDVASAISVVTKQFLKDTAVTSNQDLLVYTPSTEVSGMGGNFSGFAGQKIPNESRSMINPSANNRVRGLDSADNTRDYFMTDIPWDSFNTGRIDLQRGPNSILFGVGSPAGIINASINDAAYKTAYRFDNVVDQFGSLRNSVDSNQVLIKNRLSLRVSYLDDRRKYQQEPAFNNQNRLFASLRSDFYLLGKDNRTTIRMKYEDGKVRSNNPRILPPFDRITPWFTAPYNKVTINNFSAGNGSLSTTSPAITLLKPNGNYSFQGLASTVDVRSYFNGANATGAPSQVSNTPTNVIVGMINASIPGANNQAYRPLAIPTYSQFALGNLPGGSFYQDKVLTDSSIFNFFDTLLDGPNKREWQNWTAGNVDLQQSFFNDRLAIDLTYDKQSYDSGQIGWLAGADYGIGVEINQKMSDGSTNYNVGRPYVTGSDGFGNFAYNIDREGQRAIVTGDLRSEDIFGKGKLSYILGRSVFTGLLAADSKKMQTTIFANHAATPDLISTLQLTPESVNSIAGNRQFDWIYYLGSSLSNSNATTAAGTNLSGIPFQLTPAGSNAVRYFNQTWNAAASVNKTDPYTYVDFSDPAGTTRTGTQADNPANYVGWTNGPVNWLSSSNPEQFASLVTGGERSKFRNESKAFTWQGYLLGGDLVPTFGWREDKVINYASAAPRNVLTGVAARDYSIDPNTYRVAQGQSRNWSGVYHLPEKWTSRLPGNTKLSVFYNDSSNFKADSPRRNLMGGLIDNPAGSTKEKGVIISTLNDKVTLKANWYETRVTGATLASGFSGIFGNSSGSMYQLTALGYMMAGMLQHGMLGGAYQDMGDPGFASWFNYAYADGVPGVLWSDSLTNTSSTSAYQTAAQTIEAKATVAAWLQAPAVMNKDFFAFWNVPFALDPAKAKASGILGDAYGSKTVFWGDLIGGIITGISPTASTLPVSTVDTVSKGQEYEITARPAKNWSVTLNYVRTNATRDNVDGATRIFMNEFNTFFSGPAGNLRQWGSTSTDSRVKNVWKNNLWLPYQVLLSSQGKSAPEVSPWRLNLISSYTFARGKAKGLLVGGAARLEAGRISGYRYSSTLRYLDVNQEIIGPNDQHFDMWVGYSKKLKYKDLVWRVQLNLRNVGESTRLVPSYYEPDGSLALARIQEGMSWRLTNSIEF